MVDVSLVTAITSEQSTKEYSMIELQPSSFEDWELIEYNAEYVSLHLLEQIDVINEKYSFPVLINQTNIVYLKPTQSFRWHFVKLGRSTVVTIKPMPLTAASFVVCFFCCFFFAQIRMFLVVKANKIQKTHTQNTKDKANVISLQWILYQAM